MREAIINAIIHNDYSREIPPKFEIFSDRLEITNYGGLFEGMTKDDFFEGLSLPRNKELMRVYKDLGMVEQLGSGVPRILNAYSKECFRFTENYIRITFYTNEQVTEQVVELIKNFHREHTRKELQESLNLTHRENFRSNYLEPAINLGVVELTIPDKPNSSKQKYRLTQKGVALKNSLF